MGWKTPEWLGDIGREVADDAREATSKHSPEEHDERLRRFSVMGWRFCYFIVAVLVLGGIADACS